MNVHTTPGNAFAIIAIAAFFVLSFFTIAFAAPLERELQVGMSGSDVTLLQTFLAKDPSIYPQGIISGYYGYLTKSAVSNFQSRNGISAVGRVGPQTLPVLNAQMAGGVVNNNRTAPTISAVAVIAEKNSAFVNWNTNELAKGVVYYSTSPLTTYDNLSSVTISGNQVMTDSNMHAQQSVGISNLTASTTYYYSVYVTDQDGNVSLSWPASFTTTN